MSERPVRPASVGDADWEAYLQRYRDRVKRGKAAREAGDIEATKAIFAESLADPVSVAEAEAWRQTLPMLPKPGSRVAIFIPKGKRESMRASKEEVEAEGEVEPEEERPEEDEEDD